MKEVSVVISTYSIGRADYTMSCIDSLKSQKLLPKEIILVLEPSKSLIDFYRTRLPSNVKMVISKRCGLSNARNTGIKNAKEEIIAFIDDDAIANDEWLEKLVDNYNDSYVVGACGSVKPVWVGDRPSWFPVELDWIIGCTYGGFPEVRATVRNPTGCNMSFRRSVFEKVGYFRTDIGRLGNRLTAGEEVELSLRISQKIPGSKIIYDPSSVVYHRVPRNRTRLKYLMMRSFYEGYSKALITSDSFNELYAEQRYIKYILRDGILQRLKLLYRSYNSLNLLKIFISTISVCAGYATGLMCK